jgi:hypothetical protein
MVKKLPDTNERDGGTTFNKSAIIFAKNPADTNMRKYVDLRYRGSLFPLTSAVRVGAGKRFFRVIILLF